MGIPKEGVKQIEVGNQTYFYIAKHEFSGSKWLISIGLMDKPSVRINFSVNDNDPNLDYSDEEWGMGGKFTAEMIEKAIIYTNTHSSWIKCNVSVKLSYTNGVFELFLTD